MGRQLHLPKDIKKWSLAQLRSLIGLYVVVETPATELEMKDLGCGPWTGGSGIISEVGRHNGDLEVDVEDGAVTWVMWDYGFGYQWLTTGAQVYISTCDGEVEERPHGIEHLPNDRNAQKCLRDLGIRHLTPTEANGKYGE